MKLKEFIAECKERKVISSISVYAITAWMLIQVAATTFPYLGFPKIAITGLIILALICLPIVILFSWFYNVVPDPDKQGKKASKHKITIISFTSILSIGIIFLIFNMLSSKEAKESISKISEDKIAVAIFENFTQKPELDMIGKMAADWISHGIVQNNISPIIDYESFQNYEQLSINEFSIADPFSLSKILGGNLKIIRGSYYQSGDQLIFKCRISDSKNQTKDFGFENVEVKQGEELLAIDKLKQQILSFLSPTVQQNVSTSNSIPRYDAYQYYLQAKEKWNQDWSFTIKSLQKSLELNPNFLKASNALATAYYNTKQYKKLDALLISLNDKADVIDPSLAFSQRQISFIKYMQALLNGDNGIAFENHKMLQSYNPANKAVNIESMVTAIEFVNRPKFALATYELIPEEQFNYSNCNYCLERRELKAISDLILGNNANAIKNLVEVSTDSKRRRTFEILVKAYVQQNNIAKLNELLDNAQKKMILDKDWRYLIFIAGTEYKLKNDDTMAKKYAEKALENYSQGKPLHKMLGRIQLIAGNDQAAKVHFETFLNNRPSDTYSMSKLSQIYHRLGEAEKSLAMLDQISEHEKEYQFGLTDYHKAQAYANIGEAQKCIESLETAIKKGHRFQLYSFQNDPDFIPVFDHPDFAKTLNYWK